MKSIILCTIFNSTHQDLLQCEFMTAKSDTACILSIKSINFSLDYIKYGTGVGISNKSRPYDDLISGKIHFAISYFFLSQERLPFISLIDQISRYK